MPDLPLNKLAPPPAVAGDDRLSALLDVVGRLADQQRSLLDALRPGASMPAAVPPAAAPVPVAYAGHPAGPMLSADDVRAVVADALRAHRTSAARGAYVREHLADLPDAYRRLVPETDDPAALAAAEQDVRRRFRDDLKAVLRQPGDDVRAGDGGPIAGGPALGGLSVGGLSVGGLSVGGLSVGGLSVGGDAPGGDPPAAAIDYAKLSPLQQIAVGLRGVPTRAAGASRPKPDVSGSPGGAAAREEPDDAAVLFVGAD